MTNDDLKTISTLLDEKLASSEKRVLGEIGKFVSDELLPEIDKKAEKTDIDRLERKIDNLVDRGMDHGRRLDTIESLPTVAHELKIRRN